MNWNVRTALVVAGLIAVSGQRAEAQTASPAELMSSKVRPGDHLTVTAIDLERIRGRLIAVREGGLVLETESGEQVVSFDDIDRVSRRRFGVLLGPLIGAGVGIGFAIPVAMLLNNEGADATVASAFLIGLGASTGLLLDAAINLPRTVYRRSPAARVQVAPVMGRGRQGAALQVTF